MGADLNHVYEESSKSEGSHGSEHWRLHFGWTLWQISIWNMFIGVSSRQPSEERLSTIGYMMDQLLRDGADPNLKILSSSGPLEETEVPWLTPTNGWICFQLFANTFLPTSRVLETAPTSELPILYRQLEELQMGHLFLIRSVHSSFGFIFFYSLILLLFLHFIAHHITISPSLGSRCIFL